MKQSFDVTGMTCSACSAHVEKSVRKLPGVDSVSVNLLQNSMQVEYDEAQLTAQQISDAVDKAGYGAVPKQRAKSSAGAAADKAAARPNVAQLEFQSMRKRLIVSAAFMIPLMYISMGHMFGWPLPWFFVGQGNELTFAFTQMLLAIPILLVNHKYFSVGFKTLFKGAPNMDSLIAIGSSAAMAYGIAAVYAIGYGLGHGDHHLVHQFSMDLYFESAAMILTLITFGKYLEARSKGRTSEAISKLIDLAPKTAMVLRGGQEIEVDADELAVGDIIVVRSGQSVPVDGVMVEGSGSLDESAITGESMPVEKQPGDKVVGATINQSGYFTMRATQVGEDTTLSRIIQLVEEASGSKAPIAKLADKVSGIFVPVVIAIAVLATIVWMLMGYSFGFALSIGIAVLVISCPCALGLATPTAIMVGTGKGAENGILIKSAESLEIAHLVDTVVLDKTGTVTEGKPRVTDIFTRESVSAKQLIALAASLEQASEHPLAQAILAAANESNLALSDPADFAATAGQGISGRIGDQTVLAGNLKMMNTQGIDISGFEEKAEQLAQQGKTPLFIAANGRLLGILGVADTAKPDSKQAIEALRRMDIDVIMLTGDNEKTAKAIQRQMNIPHVIADVLPDDKEREVRKLQEQGKKVAMVGDGINDAPALARADVGIAIGAGTDVAIESADVVLVKSRLTDVVSAIQLSRAAIRNIKQNLFWAFFYNAICIPLAAGLLYPAFGIKLSPMIGAAAMSLSSVFVVSNALRLKLFKPKLPEGTADVHQQVPTTTVKTVQVLNEEQQMIDQNQSGRKENMKRTMTIEGMSCGHCSARVEKALNALAGVQATVDLEAKTATVEAPDSVSDDMLRDAVTDAGYEVTGIQ